MLITARAEKVKSKCTKISIKAKPLLINLPSFGVFSEVLVSFERFRGLFSKIRPNFRNI